MPNETTALADRLGKAKRILRAIVDADERGQGLPFSEAMNAAAAFLAHEDPLSDARHFGEIVKRVKDWK
jgi:hypothetical protein